MSTFKNLFQNPLIRNGLTFICVGIVIFLAYREYNKMMDRLEIIANELYKAKQEIVMLKHNMKIQKTTSIDKKNKSSLSKNKQFTPQMPIISKKKQMEPKKNQKINLPILNPIQPNNKSSMQRIAKHLPIKVELEDAKIITENYLLDNEIDINEEIAYNSDSDILTSDGELLDTDDEQFNDDLSDDDLSDDDLSDEEELDNILSDSSNIEETDKKKKTSNETQNIENQMSNLNEELENELNDVDLDTELNTKSTSNNEKMNETEELIENKKALKEEIEKLSSILEQDENKTKKIFGINTTIIKPEQKPKKKKKK